MTAPERRLYGRVVVSIVGEAGHVRLDAADRLDGEYGASDRVVLPCDDPRAQEILDALDAGLRRRSGPSPPTPRFASDPGSGYGGG